MSRLHLNKVIAGVSAALILSACGALYAAVEAGAGTRNMLITETGDTISLDLRGIEITEFLKVLSKKLDVNIIPTKNVSGRISLFLNNITYTDALDVVMLSQGMAYVHRGADIIMVMTGSEYEALYGVKFDEKRKIEKFKLKYASPQTVFTILDSLRSAVGTIITDESSGTIILIDTPEKLELMSQTIKDLDRPLVTEAFELQYATAADILDNVLATVTEGSGKVLLDERTNTLIVKDLPGNMSRVRQTIVMLDQETKQVLIEAEIIEISLRDRFRSGVDWERIFSDNFYNIALNGVFRSALGTGLVGSFLASKQGLDLEFLQTIGDTKTLSSPRIAVTNNEEATILVGTREAYVTGTTSQSGESTITSDTVEFVDVGVKLKVVPTINSDGFITMKIKPEISSVSRTLTTGDEDAPRSQIPIVSTSEAETTVKVKDGRTIFIGGLRQNRDQKDIDGLPFAAKIPLLNIVFSRKDVDQFQTEIIIFLTPRIITGGEVRAWDADKMKKLPRFARPENKGYNEDNADFKPEELKVPGE
jgi:type II secretory pathway component GspD/PulD (secretin)